MNVRGLTYYRDDIKANIKADTILFDIRIGSDGQRTDIHEVRQVKDAFLPFI